jgi:hypothetical protein
LGVRKLFHRLARAASDLLPARQGVQFRDDMERFTGAIGERWCALSKPISM